MDGDSESDEPQISLVSASPASHRLTTPRDSLWLDKPFDRATPLENIISNQFHHSLPRPSLVLISRTSSLSSALTRNKYRFDTACHFSHSTQLAS